MHPYDNRRYMQALGPGQNVPPGQRTNANPPLNPFYRYPFYGLQIPNNPGTSTSPFRTVNREGADSQPQAQEATLTGESSHHQPGAWTSSSPQTAPWVRNNLLLTRRMQTRGSPLSGGTHQPLLWPSSTLQNLPYAGDGETMTRRWRAPEGTLGGGTPQGAPWTGSSSSTMPYLGDDEIFAQLQAQEGCLGGSTQPHLPSVGLSSQTLPYVANDEMIARQLQAQFEAEDIQSSAAATSSSWTNRNDLLTGSSSGLTVSIDEDERLARRLRAELDAEEPQVMAEDETRATYLIRPNDAAQNPNISTGAAVTHGFAQQITRINCASCQKRFFSAPLDVVRLFKKWLSRQAQINSFLECSQCLGVTCVGCGTQNTLKNDMNQIIVKGIKLGWCCDRGRLFLIWVLLCGFDNQQSCETRRNNYFRQNNPRPSNSHRGIGYGGDPSYSLNMAMAYATVYPGASKEQRFPPAPTPLQTNSKTEVARARVDDLTEQVVVLVTALLPTFEGKSDFDLNPPPDILSMLVDSLILEKAAELLRNDSLEDATKRCRLYLCVLDFVRALGSHYTTAQAAVHGERDVKLEGIDLLKLSFATSPISKGKGKDEKTQSIASCLKNLNTQSNMMLQNAKANEQAFHAPDSQQMLRLCRRISELADFLLANSSPVDKAEDGTSNTTGWEQWQKENCLLDIQDLQILTGHHYAQEAARMQSPPTGRMKHLMLDITKLKTGLPAGIFVRHGSSRLDVMKVLIVGPVGSPYEGGLFEFDLLCPFDYPNKPPRMYFRTTGGGAAHFNPNLYRDGKVCLSLLGTWQGETWRPGKSTLLQVFLSIQAMIFCDEPWCNEPGREGQSGSQQSKNYNKTIQALTIRYAILNWLQSINNGIWNDVVCEHFKNSADTILDTVDKWAKDSSPTRLMPSPGVRATPLPGLPQLALQLGDILSAFKARQVAKS